MYYSYGEEIMKEFDKEAAFEVLSESLKLTSQQKKKLRNLRSAWNHLISNLNRSWSTNHISYVDSDINEMAAFLYKNKEFLIKIGLLSQERYDATIKLFNLMVNFAWEMAARPYELRNLQEFQLFKPEVYQTKPNQLRFITA